MFYNTNINYFLFGVFVSLIFGFLINTPVLVTSLILLFIYFIIVVSLHFKKKREKRVPFLQFRKTKEQRALAKLKKRRLKQAEKRHEMINNQFVYIQNSWNLSKEQQRVFVNFIEKRAYSDLYTKMTASLLPQLIKMVDLCIAKNKKGCKRDVTKRINQLVAIMKDEIRKKQDKKKEDFETLREVYDHLVNEIK